MLLQLKYVFHAVLTFMFPGMMRSHPTGIAILAAKQMGITPAQFMGIAILADKQGIDAGIQEYRRIKGLAP